MAPEKNGQREWARLGAQARLAQIDAERTAILRAFPDLGRGTRGGYRKKRTISPEGRKAMSEGMKRLWARRRAATKSAKSASAKEKE